MNTVTVSSAPVNPDSIPFVWGQQDARCGALCLPELVFVARKDQQEYASGFESVVGPTLLSRQVLGIDVEAEADELVEDMADRDFHASGNW